VGSATFDFLAPTDFSNPGANSISLKNWWWFLDIGFSYGFSDLGRATTILTRKTWH
jgi:hypothetical protein